MSGCLKRLTQAASSLHPDLQSRVKPNTLRQYHKACNKFVIFVTETCEKELNAELSAELLDKFIMDYGTEANLGRSKQGLLLSAVEFFPPALQGQNDYLQTVPQGESLCRSGESHSSHDQDSFLGLWRPSQFRRQT